jgi:hypothetical protein
MLDLVVTYWNWVIFALIASGIAVNRLPDTHTGRCEAAAKPSDDAAPVKAAEKARCAAESKALEDARPVAEEGRR